LIQTYIERHTRTLLIVVLLISVLLRLAASIYLGDQVESLPGTNDQLSYHNLALRVLLGHGFSFGEPWWPHTAANAPTAHWSFLYTFYLTLVYALFGPHPLAARLIQALLVGVLHPYLIYRIGKRLFGAPVGLFAAALTAIYTYFIYYSAVLMTEPFYILCVLASLWAAMQLGDHFSARLDQKPASGSFGAKCVFLGLSLAAAVLLRQLFLLFIPILFVWLWLANRRRINRELIAAALVSGALVAALILPFTLYNRSRFETFVLLNTNSGYVLFWANHPIYGTHFIPILPPEMGSYQDLIPKDLLGLDEAALDQALMKRGVQIIVDDPRRYILLSISRIPAFFMFWPSRDSELISNISRVGGFGLFLPFMLYGLVRSFFPRRPVPPLSLGSPVLLVYVFILFYTLIHLLTWALVRYRLPVDALLLVFAGLAFFDLAAWIDKRSSRSPKNRQPEASVGLS